MKPLVLALALLATPALAAEPSANGVCVAAGQWQAGATPIPAEAITARLAAAGVRNVEAMGLDTYSQPDRFFSFRRATHASEPNYGRQMSVIGLPRM